MRAKLAYQSLFKLTARVPESHEYTEFSKDIKTIAKNEFDFSYGREEVSLGFVLF